MVNALLRVVGWAGKNTNELTITPKNVLFDLLSSSSIKRKIEKRQALIKLSTAEKIPLATGFGICGFIKKQYDSITQFPQDETHLNIDAIHKSDWEHSVHRTLETPGTRHSGLTRCSGLLEIAWDTRKRLKIWDPWLRGPLKHCKLFTRVNFH